jgi:hypothetical protein
MKLIGYFFSFLVGLNIGNSLSSKLLTQAHIDYSYVKSINEDSILSDIIAQRTKTQNLLMNIPTILLQNQNKQQEQDIIITGLDSVTYKEFMFYLYGN